jgi:enterochelin esterase-like enzyme
MKKTTLALLCLLAVSALPTLAAQAQSPNDTLVSPVIANGRVTLSIYAPEASSVTIRGDWMNPFAPLPLERADNGVWSVTLDKLKPDYYSYTLFVDGVKTLDPKNPEIKQGINGVDNMFYLQGAETVFEDNRPVPHGQVRRHWYWSDTLGMQRRMHVYTPPGYDDSDEDYPVFYLLHGGGDEDSGWSTIGRAGFILDNLIAEGKAVPMIVVMPNGSLPTREASFERELMTAVMPEVESHFHVRASAENRAIAGLSMGGGHTTQVFGLNPEQFDYVSIWSAGLFNGSAADYEAAYPDFIRKADWVNNNVEYFSLVVGTDDFAHPGSKLLSETLDKHGIEHEFIETDGGHTWLNWRAYLADFAPRLFW